MKDKFIQDVVSELQGQLSTTQCDIVAQIMDARLNGYEMTVATDSTTMSNQDFVGAFIAAKKVEGCSEKSLKYYENTIRKLLESIDKWIKLISTNDLREYLAEYQDANGSSNVTMDNIRRIFSSFFSWLEDEDYIGKSPVRRIHKVKQMKVVNEAFTDENVEILRDSTDNIRDLTIVEFLNSTGVRVGELVKLNRSDINFNERSCIVLGKGNSQREVYFDARSKLHILNYLDSRVDNNEALWVSKKHPNTRLSISGVESMLRELGSRAKITKVHPHRFRRTLATKAIDKGMPVEQVQRLLGHVRIDTTLHYAMVNQTNVKNAHRKFIG
ncbi:MAG: tyrosine-type recombinase/integrase [Lactobacillaceae bacterium]|nr:tyrosine-type recombinase/integrase [Lactobacillaceae bacterium]